MKKEIEKFKQWLAVSSLYYRTEIICFVLGIITGGILF